MTISQLLDELKISTKGNYNAEGEYEIPLKDSNEWGNIGVKLDSSDLLESVDDLSYLNAAAGNMHYVFEESEGIGYDILLMADFDDDNYKLIIKELEK